MVLLPNPFVPPLLELVYKASASGNAFAARKRSCQWSDAPLPPLLPPPLALNLSLPLPTGAPVLLRWPRPSPADDSARPCATSKKSDKYAGRVVVAALGAVAAAAAAATGAAATFNVGVAMV